MHTSIKLVSLSEQILASVKPGHENDEEILALRKSLVKMREEVNKDMLEHFEILEDCIPEVTEAPWCAFTDDGKMYAVMAAGRPGDVFKFEEPPKEADGHYLLLTQPHVIQAMIHRIRHLENEANSKVRWTRILEKKGSSNGGA